MKSLIFFVFALILTLTGSYARGPGRAPAVEDFVGIESETPDMTPAGTQALFNFEQEVKDYQGRPQESQAVIVQTPIKLTTTGWSWSAWFGIAVVLALPMLTWMITMKKLKTAEAPLVASPTLTSGIPSNVTPLRPKNTADKKPAEESYKKAS